MIPIPPLQAVGVGITVGTAVVSLAINYERGDILGVAFDILDIATSGVAGKFKGAFGTLSRAMGKTDEGCGVLRRLITGGCFRGSTITYRLADVAGDSESLVAEVKPLMIPDDDQSGAMAACLLIGVGGFAWQRQRRRKKEEEHERRAIDSVFGESPQDDGLWT